MSKIKRSGWALTRKLTHAGVDHLPDGKPIVVVIDHLEDRHKELVNGKEDDVLVAIFKPNPYIDVPMIINSENATRIKTLVGFNKPAKDVRDLTITLQAEQTRLKGKTVMGLRVSPIPPGKQELTPDSSNFGMVKKWIKEQGGTIDGVKTKYDVSEDTIKKLLE